MTYTFTKHPIAHGCYEPEGIYLSAPFAGSGPIVQSWGDAPAYYGQFTYNGIPLQGYMGLGFELSAGTQIVAVDDGNVMETSHDADGFGRYIKLEHWWGESFYACLQRIQVESGQTINRHDGIGASGYVPHTAQVRFHFGMRVHPYNRFDGWGGFTDPVPFLHPTCIVFHDEFNSKERISQTDTVPLPVTAEFAGMRRP